MSSTRRDFIQKLMLTSTLPFGASHVSAMTEYTLNKNAPRRSKIGYNMLTWSAVISDDLLPMVDRLHRIGYDGVETAMGSADHQAYQRFGKHVHSLGMSVTCVLALGKDENPISDSQAVRQKGLDRIKWAVDRAHSMDAKVICGPFHSAFATFARRPPEEQEYVWSAEILRQAGDYAAQANVILALEALNRFECYLCNTMDQLNKLVKLVSHPQVKAMFDTHHANMEEKKFRKAIDEIAPVLGHVHISENDRGTPGEGHVPWEETFKTLGEHKYQGWLTIEAFTRNDPEFANNINVWREFSKPWDIADKGFVFIKNMCDKYGL